MRKSYKKVGCYSDGGAVRSERTEAAKARRGMDDAMVAIRTDVPVDLGDWGAKAAPGVRERRSAAAGAIRRYDKARRETGYE